MARHAGTRLTLIAWWTLFAAFLLPPLSALGYPIYSLEYVSAVLLAIALGSVLFLSRRKRRLHKLLLFATVLFQLLIYYYRFADDYGWVSFTIAILLVALIAALLVFEERTALSLALAACTIQIAIAALTAPSEIVLAWDRAAAKKSDRRPIIHILLDAHGGLGAIPQEPRYADGAETLKQRYLSAGFAVFPRAYSMADETRASLSKLFNPQSTSVLASQGGMLSRATALERIARTMNIDVTQFDYSRMDPWVLANDLAAPRVRVINATTAYSSIVRFGASVRDRWKIAIAGGIWWVYRWSEFPLMSWAMTSTDPGTALLEWIGVLKWPYVYIARGELLDFRARIDCCGQRGTYYFLHTYFPHGPFIFDRACNAKATTGWESKEYGTAAAYRLRYELFLDQALCASSDLMDLIKVIDSKPELKDALVIVHGDHGPRITAVTDEAKADLNYDEGRRARDRRATFLAIRDGQKPGGVIEDDVRIDAVFENLAESDFTGLDLSRVRRYDDSPYAIPAK